MSPIFPKYVAKLQTKYTPVLLGLKIGSPSFKGVVVSKMCVLKSVT